MSREQALESMIIADCGKAATRAVLVEVVDDVYRFVAQGTSPSTIEPPIDDLSAGLRAALDALEGAAARRFADRNRLLTPQEENGDGTDAFLSTVAVTPPLRLAILAIGGGPQVDALLDSGRRTPTTVLPTLTIAEGGRTDEQTRATIATLGRLRPNLLVLVATGAADRALPRLLDLASEILAAPAADRGRDDDQQSPAILFVGDERWHGAVSAAFGHEYEVGLVTSNGSAAAAQAAAAIVEQELLDLANRRAGAELSGFDELEAMSAAPPLARSRAIELVNRFMAIHFDCEVLTVELNEGATFCWARGTEHRALSEPALDLALGAANLLTTLTLANVLRWLPFTLSEDELTGWILNRAVRPFTLPTGRKDRLIEAAIARELLRTGVTELGTAGTGTARLAPDLIVGGSFFARWPNPAEALMVLVDGAQPRPAAGLVQIALDRDGLLPVVGALGLVEPDRAAELFEHDGLIDLGAYVAVDTKPGEEVRGQLDYANGESHQFTVAGGSLVLLPLRQGECAANLSIEPGERGSIGTLAPGATARFAGDDAPHGGLVGLLIDARGRSLDLPHNDQERIALLTGWLDALQR